VNERLEAARIRRQGSQEKTETLGAKLSNGSNSGQPLLPLRARKPSCDSSLTTSTSTGHSKITQVLALPPCWYLKFNGFYFYLTPVQVTQVSSKTGCSNTKPQHLANGKVVRGTKLSLPLVTRPASKQPRKHSIAYFLPLNDENQAGIMADLVNFGLIRRLFFIFGLFVRCFICMVYLILSYPKCETSINSSSVHNIIMNVF